MFGNWIANITEKGIRIDFPLQKLRLENSGKLLLGSLILDMKGESDEHSLGIRYSCINAQSDSLTKGQND